MNDYGIPIIEPTVDFTKVPPIHQKRTITFVNHFIINTVTFLNNFALCCEEKLFQFENKLQRVEASLEILESRLSSILEADSQAKNPETLVPTESETKVEKEEEIKAETVEVGTAECNEKKIEDSNLQPISKDPKYSKYFNMVQFGVPVEAVRLKMKQGGLDPLILDDPGLLVPIIKVADTNTTTDDKEDA